eukprot:3753823-Rhodomonas_salina.1
MEEKWSEAVQQKEQLLLETQRLSAELDHTLKHLEVRARTHTRVLFTRAASVCSAHPQAPRGLRARVVLVVLVVLTRAASVCAARSGLGVGLGKMEGGSRRRRQC